MHPASCGGGADLYHYKQKGKTEQQMVGTLSAMGYTRTQLARHYAGFAAIPGIIGGVLTSVVTAVAAQPYGELGLTDYETNADLLQLELACGCFRNHRSYCYVCSRGAVLGKAPDETEYSAALKWKCGRRQAEAS